MRLLRVCAALGCALGALGGASASAQLPARPPLNVGESEPVDRWRLAILVDSAPRTGFFIRSTSSVARPTGPAVERIGARVAIVNNSALPTVGNDGAMWAGRGLNLSISGGVVLRTGRFTAIVAPELAHSSNSFVARDNARFYAPDIPADRSEHTLFWYSGPFSADVPIRFGDNSFVRVGLGQSSLAARFGGVAVGFATENQWWGPGLRNALVLSNAAPGFPHFFVRSASPWGTWLGALEFKWIVGGLSESPYFDTVSTNDVRSLSAMIVALEPKWSRNLTVGAARSVMATATGWGEVPLRWFDVLRRVQPANDLPLDDSTLYPGGREEIVSLFAHLRLPESGFEAHVEWGRTEFPRRPRELLVYPAHSSGYTLGLQWRSSPSPRFWRVQTELTNVEQSSSFRDRAVGVWYTSRRVIQGYTNRGEPLGAAVGPGSSGQWLAFDRVSGDNRWGIFGGRTRFNESVRNIYAFPAYQAYCNHDVNMFWGARMARMSRMGLVTVDATLANRINLWFQVGSGCPRGDTQLDVRNRTLSITFEPFARRRATTPR